jgi:hypothetical protein
MQRIALDTDAVNRLADAPGLVDVARRARACGALVFGISHSVCDQLAATEDPDRRTLLLNTWAALPKTMASADADVLVTDDRTLAQRATCVVWPFEFLRRVLEDLDGPTKLEPENVPKATPEQADRITKLLERLKAAGYTVNEPMPGRVRIFVSEEHLIPPPPPRQP